MTEYKAVMYKENIFGSILLGQSKIDPENFTEFLNDYARQGWRLVHFAKEERRTLLFWSREALVVVFER